MPIPPVFSPWSLSSARLWSMEDAMGTTVSPSVKDSTDTSGPVRNSSMTTVAPLSPNARSSIMERTAARAASRVSQINTPFPRARPSALTTAGRGHVST